MRKPSPTFAESLPDDDDATRAALDTIEPRDLGKYRFGFTSMKRTISAADDKMKVFQNLVREACGYVRHGLDKQLAVDELADMALNHDLARRHGADIQQIIADVFDADAEREVRPPHYTNGQSGQRERFKLIAINDIVLDDAPLWLVSGLIPTGPSFGVIFGKPKSGKTFVTADLFFHVAMGWPYCDCAVRQGGIVYITSEGIRGFDRRMVAMRQHHNVEGMMVPFYVAHDMPNLGTKNGDAEKLAQVIRAAIPKGVPVAAVIIDTLVRAMSGKNDSASEDMAVFVDNCETIARALQCFVGAVHHSLRGDDTRTRGSNVLDGAADVIISVIKDDASHISTAKIEASKDSEEGLTWRFHVTEKRNQNDGFAPLCETISITCRDSESETAAKPKMTAEQRRLFDILCNTIIESGRAVPGSILVPRGINAVTRDQLKKCLLTAGFLDPQKPDSARSLMSKYLNQLAGKGLIGTDAEHVWLPK